MISNNKTNELTSLLNKLKQGDVETYNHCMRTAAYSEKLGTQLSLDSKTAGILFKASMLHDIGKLRVDKQVLKKASQLTDSEYELVKKHAYYSGEMIKENLPQDIMLVEAVISHHERWDGGGYPRGLAQDDIPFLGRVIAIADCYDAITSKRSYRSANTKKAALYEIERISGTQLDPKLADVFLQNANNT